MFPIDQVSKLHIQRDLEKAQKVIKGGFVMWWNMLHIICIWFWNSWKFEPFNLSLNFCSKIYHVSKFWDSPFFVRKFCDSSKFESFLPRIQFVTKRFEFWAISCIFHHVTNPPSMTFWAISRSKIYGQCCMGRKDPSRSKIYLSVLNFKKFICGSIRLIWKFRIAVK